MTLDADLQNPPEDTHLLLAKMDEGHDYVGSIRRQRNDSWWRHVASRAMNGLRERITRIKMTDQGCMFRAYDRNIIDAINSCKEVNTFIPALAYSFARNPAEVVVGHEERAAGESKYSLYSLIRLNFDLMTSFSLVPLQMFSMLGMLISVFSALFFVFLVDSPPDHRSRSGRLVHAVRIDVLPDRHRAVRHRPPGRIHRTHLPASAPPSALSGGGGAGTADCEKPKRRAGTECEEPAAAVFAGSIKHELEPSSSPTTMSASAA